MKALVTGGGGFLGGALVRALLARDDEVCTFQRGSYPALVEAGAMCFAGDLSQDTSLLENAATGCDVVFHVAAKAGVWGSRQSYEKANVVATQNVIEACRKCRVPRLVFTSSPSVVFDGRDENGIDERAPYPERYLAHYPRTKAAAERAVLAAHGEGLATVALRPHLIFGPGDPHLVPRIVERARAGRLRLVGRQQNLVDSTYIDNAVHAHLLAADRLAEPRPAETEPAENEQAGTEPAEGRRSGAACGGQAYFISNGEPLPMAELVNRILAAAGLPPVERYVSPATAYAAGAVLETVYRLLRRRDEPLMTRFVARQLSRAHWYDLSRARRDLGYEPIVSLDEGLKRLGAWLAELQSTAHAGQE